MKNTERGLLSFKLFIIIVFFGVILPYMVEYIVRKIMLLYTKPPFDNSIYVLNNYGCKKNFFDIFIKLLMKLSEI